MKPQVSTTARDTLGAALGYRQSSTGTWSGPCPECDAPDANVWSGGLTCPKCVVLSMEEAALRYLGPTDETPWPALRLPGPPEPERLPLDVLPPALAGHVESVSAALQVPHELPELLALACVSAAVAGRVEVEPRAGWREPVGIYTATILPPAARKSPTFAAMTAPGREWEEEAVQLAAPRYLSALDAVDVARADLEATKRAAANSRKKA